ncbi:hypothetical protein L1987_54509 [Smallanthus sonchifolius]|uniref:Uncharacterized protein n=1 Tax=Smallanthus sonchifolius TaxID=185202 RepID=A0ACB9E7P7_9ASTR|nr:hypothetical protein L1987_54509 [Smallanthus sonchifolius]
MMHHLPSPVTAIVVLKIDFYMALFDDLSLLVVRIHVSLVWHCLYDSGSVHHRLAAFYLQINYARRFENKAIALIYFSARYQLDVIQEAISALGPPLAGCVLALTEGF